MCALRCENIHKIYGKSQQATYAVRGISAEFQENTFYSVIGKSGSGKSTLIHLLSGLLKADRGEIFYDEQPLSTMNEQQLEHIKKKMPRGCIYRNRPDAGRQHSGMTGVFSGCRQGGRKPCRAVVKKNSPCRSEGPAGTVWVWLIAGAAGAAVARRGGLGEKCGAGGTHSLPSLRLSLTGRGSSRRNRAPPSGRLAAVIWPPRPWARPVATERPRPAARPA